MKYQLANTTLMMPRVPLTLIAVRLPENCVAAVSNYIAYTPLALVFRHIHAINAVSTQSLCYINQAGDNVVIAPRIHLTLQWAEQLQSIINPHFSFTQRVQLNNGLLQSYSPFQKQYFLENSGQLIFRKPILLSSAHTLDRQTLINDNYLLHLKKMYVKQSLGTQVMSSAASKKAENTRGSFAQQDLGISHAISVLSSFVAKRYLMLRDRINTQLNQDTHAATVVPSKISMDNLKYEYLNHDYKVITQFQQKTEKTPISFFQFNGQMEMLFRVDNNSLSKRINNSSVQLNRHRHVQSVDNHLIATSARRLAQYSFGLFSQSFRRTYQQAFSPVAVDAAVYGQPTTGMSDSLGNTRYLEKHLHLKKKSHRRQANNNYPRSVTQAEVVYRSDKAPVAPAPAPVTVTTTSEPIPVAAPQIDIDRLSTDVLHQLEKRIRIERERHGRL